MKPRKVRKCSSVVLREFALIDDAANILKDAVAGSKEIKLPWGVTKEKNLHYISMIWKNVKYVWFCELYEWQSWF